MRQEKKFLTVCVWGYFLCVPFPAFAGRVTLPSAKVLVGQFSENGLAEFIRKTGIAEQLGGKTIDQRAVDLHCELIFLDYRSRILSKNMSKELVNFEMIKIESLVRKILLNVSMPLVEEPAKKGILKK